MSAFLLNLYDATLDLVDKDDRKLFQEGYKGLKESNFFGGKKKYYGNFMKLIERDLNCNQTMKALKITTECDTNGSTAAAKRIPTQEGMVDILKSNKATSKEIQKHCNMVWDNLVFGVDTPRYFDIFNTASTNTATLDGEHTERKIKHVMMGDKLGNS